uniref:Uncharacterized protein n=1 Tax=Anopheles atroparvus TaxID=41427 RepID=A0A182JHP4_ANOAO
MSALNSTTIVAPTGSAVHINDFTRQHKPDEPAVGGFLPAAHAPSIVSTSGAPGPPLPAPDVPVNVATNAGDDAVGAHSTASDPSGHSAAAAAALLSHSSSSAILLNQLLSFSAQMASGGGSVAPASNGPAGGTGGGAGHKKCPYHRQCSRSHHHLNHQHLHQQQQQQQQPAANVQGHPYAAAWNRYRNGGGSSMAAHPSQQRDAISTNVSPPPLNAVILAERYLMMEPVEGNNLYRCCDIKSHEELVCKIANNPCSNLLTAHFRLEGHPHVNALHKVIQGNNKTYLLFSPSEGDLHSYVRVRKRLREPEARRLCRQMCEVVKSCHEQGIVLRDLKLRKFVFADRERNDFTGKIGPVRTARTACNTNPRSSID